MDEKDFEGSEVLEKLAAIDKVDEFFEALDGDDFESAKRLMKMARIESNAIEIVLSKMQDADGDH